MKKKNTNKKGFTLMELLTVVVIIGVLSSIALPMYKKAVEKSKASDALTTMQAVAKSEHDWYLSNNNYTKDFDDLDIDLTGVIENGILKTTYYNYELLDKGILASRTNGEYSLYKDYEISQIMCSPSEHYICENFGKLTKEPCQKVGMAWANSNTTCYATDEARCKDLHGNSTWNESKGFCGYTNTKNKTLGEGVACNTSAHEGCSYSTITAGGVCEGNVDFQQTCENAYVNGGTCDGIGWHSCANSEILNGGVCNAVSDSSSCYKTNIREGGTCTSLTRLSCQSPNIYSGGVCNGNASVGCAYSKIKEGAVCNANSAGTNYEGACQGSRIESGGVCQANAAWGCMQSTIQSGGICRGDAANSCTTVTVQEGGECLANVSGACGSSGYGDSTYEGTGSTSGCCRGTYCPSNAPRCECTNHEKMDSSGNCITG